MVWDLVVIDEAYRLPDLYKTSGRIALAIKNAISAFPEILLAATPLQNSLLELYGLVSIIDDYAFGDLKSFRARFARLANSTDFTEFKERPKPICKRRLRRQVQEFVPCTDRHAWVQEFVPSAGEQKRYVLAEGAEFEGLMNSAQELLGDVGKGAATLPGFVARLDATGAAMSKDRPAASDEAAFDVLLARYTMERERDVHRDFLHGLGLASKAVAQSASNPDADDGVLLF